MMMQKVNGAPEDARDFHGKVLSEAEGVASGKGAKLETGMRGNKA